MTPLIRKRVLGVVEVWQSAYSREVLMLLLLLRMVRRRDMSKMRTAGALADGVVIRERSHAVGYLEKR